MKQIIKFEKDNCAPCKQVTEFLKSKTVPFESINPFNDPELAQKFNIRSVPTTLVVEGDEVRERIVGANIIDLEKIVHAYSV